MKLTLITVCRDSAAVIRTALESVLSQRGAEIEYIVVDGASTDGTVDILREYAEKFRLRSRAEVDGGDQDSIIHCQPQPRAATSFRWLSEPDEGMYDAMNKGIRLSTWRNS